MSLINVIPNLFQNHILFENLNQVQVDNSWIYLEINLSNFVEAATSFPFLNTLNPCPL